MTTPATPDCRPAPIDLGKQLSAHRPYLVRYAGRRLRDAALVEDVVQETLLAALQQVDSFEQRAVLRTWLTAILQRRIVDSVRRQARRDAPARDGETDAELSSDGDGAEPHTDEPVDWIDPSRRLEGRQFIAALSACLAALPPAAARLFTLREVDGLNNEEAAHELGLSQRHSALMLHRARNRLRVGLAAHATVGMAA